MYKLLHKRFVFFMSVVAPHSSNTFNTIDVVVIYPTFSDKKGGDKSYQELHHNQQPPNWSYILLYTF